MRSQETRRGGSETSLSIALSDNKFRKIRPLRAELFIGTDGRTDTTQQVPSKRHALNNSGRFSLGNQWSISLFRIIVTNVHGTSSGNRCDYEITELLTFHLQNSDLHKNCHFFIILKSRLNQREIHNFTWYFVHVRKLISHLKERTYSGDIR